MVESIQKFPNQADFASMIKTAGFKRVGWDNLSGGISAIHSGWKLEWLLKLIIINYYKYLKFEMKLNWYFFNK